MQLRRHGLQLLVLLMTLTATEPWSAAQILCPPIDSDIALSSLDSRYSLTLPPLNPSPSVSSPSLIFPHYDVACLGKSSLSALVNKNKQTAIMLGFKDPEEVSKPDSVMIGEPYALYQVDLLDLRRFNPAADPPPKVADFIKLKKDRQIYPLLTERPEDGLKVRAALVLSEQRGGKWTTTALGLAQLIQAMDKYKGIKGFDKGFVVWIPALNLHFLGNKFDEKLHLIPLADRLAYGIEKGKPIWWIKVLSAYKREAFPPYTDAKETG